jgi:hypothetical protein
VSGNGGINPERLRKISPNALRIGAKRRATSTRNGPTRARVDDVADAIAAGGGVWIFVGAADDRDVAGAVDLSNPRGRRRLSFA